MRKLLFLLLASCWLSAQAQKPKIIFRSGFENGAYANHFDYTFMHEGNSYTYNALRIDGADNTYLPPNNWSNFGGYNTAIQDSGFFVTYGVGTLDQRFAEITDDPINDNNSVMRFKAQEPHDYRPGYWYARLQADLSLASNPMKEYSCSIRVLFPDDIDAIGELSYVMPNWFTLMEIWNSPAGTGDPYPSRVSLALSKVAGQELHFKLEGTYMNHINTGDCAGNYNDTDCFQGWYLDWSTTNSTFKIPTGKWMTLRMHFKDGDAQTGRFMMTATPDGEAETIIFNNSARRTRHPQNINSTGSDFMHPFKLYVSDQIINYIKASHNGNGQTQLFWDDYIVCDKPDVDLQIRDTPEDLGVEPNTVSPYFWGSNDIWVRNANDDGLEHQNPEYNPNQPNYVRVRVNNKSCKPSTEGSILKVYWAKAGTALTWPENWDGSLTMNGALMGKPIGEIPIPPLAAGKDIILTLPFNVPDPTIYQDITTEPWHFCLLARIESTEDPMSYDETGLSVVENARNNNNVGWKNITIVDIVPNAAAPIGASVSVRNPGNEINPYDIVFTADTFEPGNAIFEEAEVNVTIDNVLLHAWVDGGKILTNLKPTKDPHRFVVTGNHAKLENLKLPAETSGILNLSFNFLTQNISEKQEFTYHVIQNDKRLESRVIGGETYLIRKSTKPLFSADAGADKQVRKNEAVTLKAGEISNLAVYNWYDMDGNLIYVGKDLTVNAEVTKRYKLEVIDIDGYKDYDEIEVKVSQSKFGSITPNPATNWINVNFDAPGVNSAYLMVVNINNGVSYNYILDPSVTQKSINIEGYQNGLYKILLICDGAVADENTLVKN